MENLFRLMLVRPAVIQDSENPSIDLTQNSPYQSALVGVFVSGSKLRSGARRASTAFVNSQDFVGEPAATPLAEPLAALAQKLDELEGTAKIAPKDVADAIDAAFGNSANKVAGSARFAEASRRLRDSLVAIKTLQEEHGRPIEDLARQLRTLELVARVAADGSFPPDREALRRWRRRSLRLPGAPALKPRTSTRAAEAKLREVREATVELRRNAAADLIAQHARLQVAVKELASLPSSHFQESAQVESAGVRPPEQLRLASAFSVQTSYATEIRSLHVAQLRRSLDDRRDPDGEKPAAAAPAVAQILAKPMIETASKVLAGRTKFVPTSLSDIGFVLAPSAARALSKDTRALLGEHAIDLSAAPLDKVTERLQTELAATVAELEQLAGYPVKQSFMRVGDALVSIQTPVAIDWGAVAMGGVTPLPMLPLDGRIPHTRGDVASPGIADLLVVKQQLIGYEAVDVAHIENVLKGERKLREHTRREQTEVVTLTETEMTKSEERELESTDRFEMTRETSETIKEDVSIKAGLKISGKYGPAVEFAVSAEGAYSRSKEEATKSASKFSQDVTERSARKIAERVLQKTQTTTTTETIEKNTHELDNVVGDGHISGVYQWVNKVYRAQMYNYGLRTMFDFMVPEPAAFLIAAMTQAHNSSTSLVKPPDFTLTPSQITEANYPYWTKVCGATDVAPAPELFKTKSSDFKAGGGDSDADYNHSGQIGIDEGYRAIFGSVGVVWNTWEDDCCVDLVLGRRTHRRLDGGSWLWTTTLDDERDSIPFAIDSWRCSQIAVAIEVKCQRTDRAMEKWRLETHGKLATAHKALVADYEDKLAALQIRSGIAIHGNNPAANLVTIENELKKNCITILTDQHFDLFNAIETSPGNGLPQMDVFEAAGEGPYVRFFEQAFEWEHMTYVTYPYFWGRKNQWDERIAYEDPDPAFADFLRAGYCRVSVPARPGFEGAIDHYLTFGETWNGGPLPAIASPLYLPIADEIAERLDRPGAEIPQGDPWTVRIPTNLVHLRADDALPKWKQNAAGEWVEA